MMSPVLSAAFVVALGFVTSAQALVLRNYSPDSHDRIDGFPFSSPVPNSTFIFANLDLTGVGFSTTDTRRQYTLVSPVHFIGANHFRPGIGSVVRFVAADGTIYNRTVEALYTIPNDDDEATDLLLGKFSEPTEAATGIRYLPYLNLASEAAYTGKPLAILGKPARGGRGTLGAFSNFGGDPVTSGAGINETRVFQFTYNNFGGQADDAYAEAGDSGSPSLVDEGGVGAIVGVHTAVSSTFATRITFDTFVPHYITELNEVMEAEGYHMTEVTPASVTLGVSQQATGMFRAGYPFTISIDVTNPDSVNDVNNLRLSQALSATGELQDVVASGSWVSVSASGDLDLRRGGLGAATTSTIQLELNFADPGSYSSAVTLDYDEGAQVTSNANLAVIESYLSWSSDLVDADPSADPDGDGAPNLLEYALASDPNHSSPERMPQTSYLQVDGEARAQISFVRRTDATERALSYVLEMSDTLESTSWVDASSDVISEEATPLSAGLETVDLQFPVAAERRFFRLRVELAE